MAKKINAVFTVGPDGTGAKIFTKLLTDLLKPRHTRGAIGCIDLGDIVAWYRKLHSPIGDEIRRLTNIGLSLPDELVEKMFFDWLENECIRNPSLETLLVSEFPTCPENMVCAAAFERAVIIDLDIGQSRNETMNSHGGIVLHLNFSKPLAVKLKAVLEHLKSSEHSPIERNVVIRGLNRLRADNHPIHEKIQRLEATASQTAQI